MGVNKPYRPQIIVCDEKHGTFYWDASTPEARDASALAILTERWKLGYYQKFEYTPHENILTQEQIDALPTEELRKTEQRKLNYDQRARREYAEINADVDLIEAAVRDKDGKAAWRLLSNRSDYEYEGVSMETVFRARDNDA